jgi:hypothetical protein
VIDQGLLEGSDLRLWPALVVVGVAHGVFGYVVRDWVALILPVVVLFLAVPAGPPESGFSEPGLVWFAQLVMLPAEVVLLVAGLGLRALVERWRKSARWS